jgi:sigma-B regulation protein RsbU (phosphoserine phosphatase)
MTTIGSVGRTPSALVVERDGLTVELTRQYLEAAGFRVVTARDGEDGLAKARALRPDLVVCEVFLRKLDGLQLCREIRGDPTLAGTRVMITTWCSLAESDAVKAGADAFLSKPLESDAVIEFARALMEEPGPASERN